MTKNGHVHDPGSAVTFPCTNEHFEHISIAKKS